MYINEYDEDIVFAELREKALEEALVDYRKQAKEIFKDCCKESIKSYENAFIVSFNKGFKEGIEKERNRVAEAMRKNGFTEEQIKLALGEKKSEPIVTMRELSPEEKLKEIAYYREKRLHDEASALGYAERKGETRGIAKGREEGREEKPCC